MINNFNQPQKFDAVLGGQAPPPVDSLVLGGIEGVKHRLQSKIAKERANSLIEAFNYGEEGLDLVIAALLDSSKQVQRFAYELIRKKAKHRIKQALQIYKPWNLVERFEEYPGYKQMNATLFANRHVVEFEPNTSSITDVTNTAYALRYDYEEDVISKLDVLLQDPQASELEALIFGLWNWEMYEGEGSGTLINKLVDVKDCLKKLKALFIGDISFDECEISWIRQSDISPILKAYPQLEILQIRGGECLEFSYPVHHENLKALIIETGGLNKATLEEICRMNLPALEHLELWFGSENYGGDCWVEDLVLILEEETFSNLTYLGLRNSQFTDEMVDALVTSPIINSISVLDLSMGTLSDDGAEKLLKYPAINNLYILNISESFLSEEMIKQFGSLNIKVIANNQKSLRENSYINSRYCSVSE